MRTSIDTGKQREAGFTLFEMLVVLLIVGGLMSVVVTLARPRGDALALRQLTMEVALGLRAARSHAVWRNQETEFWFDAEERLFRGLPGTRVIALPPDASATLETAKHDESDARSSRFTFFPDGSSSGGRVILRRAGQEIRVTVDWLSGSVSVDDPSQ